jgi:hypothetical protein
MAIHDRGAGPPETRRGAAPATEPHPRLLAKAASSTMSITASAGERQAPTATSPVVIAFPQRRVKLERRAIRHLSALAADLVELGATGRFCFGRSPAATSRRALLCGRGEGGNDRRRLMNPVSRARPHVWGAEPPYAGVFHQNRQRAFVHAKHAGVLVHASVRRWHVRATCLEALPSCTGLGHHGVLWAGSRAAHIGCHWSGLLWVFRRVLEAAAKLRATLTAGCRRGDNRFTGPARCPAAR